MLPPPVESQGLLTTKAPLWVTSSLLPILAATSLNPPSLLVTNKRQQAGCEGGKPIYLGSAASKAPACLRSVAALLALLLCEERRGWFCCSLLPCSEKLELFLVPCPAHAELEQFALSILDSCNCERTLQSKGSTKGIPILFVFV